MSILLRTQKNEVFELIKAQGLNPSDFRWVEEIDPGTRSRKIEYLYYRDTSFYFLFDLVRDVKHWNRRSPGEQSITESDFPGSWTTQKNIVIRWLRSLKREVNSPDLWEFARAQKDISSLDSKYQLPFADEFKDRELLEIESKLNEVKEYIKAGHKLSEKQTEVIEGKLDYLMDAAKRVGPKDWKVMVMGTIFSLMVSSQVDQETMKDILAFLTNVVTSIFENASGSLPL